MSNYNMSRNRWRRTAGGAMVGTAVAGGLLLSGSTPTLARGVPAGVVARAAVPSGQGYWLVDAYGEVYAFGDAMFYGSLNDMHLKSPIVGIVAAPDGKGYWLVAKDGEVYPFGSAKFHGSLPSMSIKVGNIVGITALPGAGAAGPAGAQGPQGAIGPQGPAGSGRSWRALADSFVELIMPRDCRRVGG